MKLHQIDVFNKFCSGALKFIMNSRNMKKTQLENIKGHEIYVQI